MPLIAQWVRQRPWLAAGIAGAAGGFAGVASGMAAAASAVASASAGVEVFPLPGLGLLEMVARLDCYVTVLRSGQKGYRGHSFCLAQIRSSWSPQLPPRPPLPAVHLLHHTLW